MPRPARPWFRMYSEALDNPKIQGLKPVLRCHWLNLMFLANITGPRGSLPVVPTIAFRLRITHAQAEAVVRELVEQGLVDDLGGHLRMHDWDEWQFESDTRDTVGRRKRGDSAAQPPQKRGAKHNIAPPRSDQIRSETDQKQNPPYIPPQPETEPIRLPLLKLAEQSFGRLLSPMEIELLKALDSEHPYERIAYSFRVAAENNAKKMRYVKAVCEGEEQNGDRNERQERGVAGVAQTASVDSELARYGSRPEFVLDP